MHNDPRACATSQGRGNARIKAPRNMDICGRKKDQERTQEGVCKVRSVSRTLISVDRRQETGHDVILTKNQPRIVDVRTAETLPLRKSKGMSILDLWLWIPTGQARAEKCSDFVRQRRVALVMCLFVRCLKHNEEKSVVMSVSNLRHMKMKMREKKKWSAKIQRRSRRERRLSLIPDSQAGENEKNMRQRTRNTGVGAVRA